ncbi:hypothetical protein AGLY_014814 [Aphis glycines]|uniref:Uncharacterized protein n=1 Tax=Aphis glycines TaxID=307491 RepID=A0A6G0T3J1_APHGL|nr:hypothetical protein AGLY_014814 [Aphis glycines]
MNILFTLPMLQIIINFGVPLENLTWAPKFLSSALDKPYRRKNRSILVFHEEKQFIVSLFFLLRQDSGRSDSTEVTEKDSKPDVHIKKPELLSLKCKNLEKLQAFASTVDIKIKKPKVEEAKQIISDVSPDNYTREHVQLSDLKVYLNVPINEIGAFMSPTNMSSDKNNIKNINVPPISEDLNYAE